MKGHAMDFVNTVFDINRYMPHGYCLLWQTELLMMHIISDVVITIAYFSIPCTIAFLLIKRKQTVPFRWAFVMFALFIVLCGVTHAISVIVLWHPFYYFQGILKTMTALVSLATAILMFPLIPRLLDIFADFNKDETSDESRT